MPNGIGGEKMRPGMRSIAQYMYYVLYVNVKLIHTEKDTKEVKDMEPWNC